MENKPKSKGSQISLQALIISLVLFGSLHVLIMGSGYKIGEVIPVSLAILAATTIAIKKMR